MQSIFVIQLINLNPDIRKRALGQRPHLYGLLLITTLYKHL